MKALLIGTGMVAPTHVAALKGAGLELACVMGRDPARTEAFTETHGGTSVTTLTAALATQPDIAIVTTPPDARAEIATALASARIPTLIEKPIERTLQAARAIVETFEAADVPLGLFFQHRTRAASKHLKSLLARGELGAVIHAEMRVPWWRDQSYYDAPGRGTYARDGGGVLITQAIHTLDLCLWLCGPTAQVQAMTRRTPLHRLEAEDLATALLQFDSGATGLLSATTAAFPGSAETITLICEAAHVTLTGDHLVVDYLNGHRDEITPLQTGTGGGADPMAFSHGWHQNVIEDFVSNLAQNASPPISGREGLAVHALIDAMERAATSRATEKVHP
ncbi:Gfo/Idh/MocA family protein [Primorskyibacter sp. S187A]|uniref:Gfo/Idh/MocA family protein n=1 Tax=Primorskyibacter sp. S187A TaxID=3415130 RepID=UPI003C79CC4E